MYHSNRRFLKLLETNEDILLPAPPRAKRPNSLTAGGLIYLYALPALAPAPGLRAPRSRELSRAPQNLEPRPSEVTGRPPPALPGHEYVGHYPQQRASAARQWFSTHQSPSSPTSPSAYRPRSSLPRLLEKPSNLV